MGAKPAIRFRREQGFTLIEIITVIILLSIVSVIGGNLIVTSTESYYQAQSRSKLIQKGRLSIERMVRQLRIAAPNSLRVSASGACLEFMPVVAGANYLVDVPDIDNGAPLISAIAAAPFVLGMGTVAHVLVAPLDSGEIYTLASPSARVGIGVLGGAPLTSVPLTSPYRFLRNSTNKRVYLADSPARFCVSGGELLYYTDYGLDTGALDDTDPGGSRSLLSRGIAAGVAGAFVLSPGTVDRNTTVDVHLQYTEGGESVVLNHTVFIRNVP